MNPADTLSDWNAGTTRRANTMFHLAATLHTLGITTATHIQDHLTEIKSNPDRGSVTLGLFVLALAVVAGITVAVKSRLALIN